MKRVNGVIIMSMYKSLVVANTVARKRFRRMKEENGSAKSVAIVLEISTELADVQEVMMPTVVLARNVMLANIDQTDVSRANQRWILCVPRAQPVQLGSLGAVAAAVPPIHSANFARKENLHLERTALPAMEF